jgi:hypothetical protein
MRGGGKIHNSGGFKSEPTRQLWRAILTPPYSDTHPKMEALQIQLWRQASPTRKMNMLAQLNSSAQLLALTGLRSQYPRASEAELRRKLADLLLGEDLAHKVYGEASLAK